MVFVWMSDHNSWTPGPNFKNTMATIFEIKVFKVIKVSSIVYIQATVIIDTNYRFFYQIIYSKQMGRLTVKWVCPLSLRE